MTKTVKNPNPKRGRPTGSARKTAISLRLDDDVLDYFRAKGRGWQTRINDVLKGFVKMAK